METDAVNLNIREHEEVVATSWEFSERARDIYRFFDLFNQRFFGGELPTPVISFRPGRLSSLGWYRIGRNEVGVKDQINLNSRHLELPRCRVLVTLLHEMTHEWQDYFGRHGKGYYYHNKQFQAKTRELGIPSDSRGRTIDVTDPFVAFCRKHGVDFSQLDDLRKQDDFRKSKQARSKSKLRKYTCGCTNIWAATKVIANCKRCGSDFRLNQGWHSEIPAEEVSAVIARVPDPHLFDGLLREQAERWAVYFYRFPKNLDRKASLKQRVFCLYDPFAHRSKFPAGIRYSANIYTGCPHHCGYCYIKNYVPRAEEPREKKDLLGKAKRDIEDMRNLNLPPVPLHISNSTDPFQEPLETQTKTTFELMKFVTENREHFTTLTFLTKNPALPAREPYLSLLKGLEPCQVEVSLTFYDDKGRRFYEPDAPSVESRLSGIKSLREAGVRVSLRIDPLFPREPLPKPFWEHSELRAYGVERTHSLREIEALVSFAASEGCQRIIVSPLKVPVGRRSPCWLKHFFRALYSEPFGGNPHIRGLALRLPENYIHEELFPPVLEICNKYGIEMRHCKINLINTY